MMTPDPAEQLLREWKPHLVELGLIIGFYALYLLTRGLIFPQLDQIGLQNAHRVVSLERGIWVFWEPAWQAWTLEHAEFAVAVLNWVYVVTFWPIVRGVGLVLYIRHRPRFYYYRTVVAVSLVFALTVFAVFPVSPPFVMTAYFVDTIQTLGPALYGSPEMAVFYNTNAAMPSLHFCWTVILGVLCLRSLPGKAKVLGILYPGVTLLAITITGNNFILDAVAVGLMAGEAFAIVELGLREQIS